MDFNVENHGSIYLLRPMSDAGVEWAEQHLPSDAQKFGGAYVVEWRFIGDICGGIEADGLEVS